MALNSDDKDILNGLAEICLQTNGAKQLREAITAKIKEIRKGSWDPEKKEELVREFRRLIEEKVGNRN